MFDNARVTMCVFIFSAKIYLHQYELKYTLNKRPYNCVQIFFLEPRYSLAYARKKLWEASKYYHQPILTFNKKMSDVCWQAFVDCNTNAPGGRRKVTRELATSCLAGGNTHLCSARPQQRADPEGGGVFGVRTTPPFFFIMRKYTAF